MDERTTNRHIKGLEHRYKDGRIEEATQLHSINQSQDDFNDEENTGECEWTEAIMKTLDATRGCTQKAEGIDGQQKWTKWNGALIHPAQCERNCFEIHFSGRDSGQPIRESKNQKIEINFQQCQTINTRKSGQSKHQSAIRYGRPKNTPSTPSLAKRRKGYKCSPRMQRNNYQFITCLMANCIQMLEGGSQTPMTNSMRNTPAKIPLLLAPVGVNPIREGSLRPRHKFCVW